MGNEAKYGACNAAPTRTNAINCLRNTIYTAGPCYNGSPTQVPSFYDNLTALESKLSGTGIKIAVTEANICYGNDVLDTTTPYNYTTGNNNNPLDQTDDTKEGNGANSFIAGQFWAEAMAIGMEKNLEFMTFWATIEGNPATTGAPVTETYNKTNIGFLENNINADKKSTYYHFQLMAQNFIGDFYPTSSISLPTGIKTFASINAFDYRIMILNQTNLDRDFRINVDPGAFNSLPGILNLDFNLTSDPQLLITLNLNYSYDSPITKPLAANSTVVLTFDCTGTLQGRVDYTIADANLGNAPHIRQIGNNDVDPQMAACNQPGIGGTINTNTTYSNTTVYVTSDILLASNTNLTFDNCKVILAPDVKIKATPMASIDIKNNTVMVGCNGKQWKGIEMIGNYQNGERLHIENSYIFNAKQPVKTEKIPDLKILGNVFANGETALELNRSQAFTITGNLIAGYKTGLITTNTKPNYVSAIKENRFIEVITGADFTDDGHNMLDITCNEFRFSDKGIKSRNTDLKQQGDSIQSAGNLFVKTAGQQKDYIDHLGSPTKYYFGPAEANQFSYPNVMNIPKIQSISNKACNTAFSSQCLSISVPENFLNTPQMLVFPNPSSGSFTSSFSNLPKGNWTLNVHDMLGRLISSNSVDATKERTLQINAKGLYFISLQNGNNRITQKVIVE